MSPHVTAHSEYQFVRCHRMSQHIENTSYPLLLAWLLVPVYEGPCKSMSHPLLSKHTKTYIDARARHNALSQHKLTEWCNHEGQLNSHRLAWLHGKYVQWFAICRIVTHMNGHYFIRQASRLVAFVIWTLTVLSACHIVALFTLSPWHAATCLTTFDTFSYWSRWLVICRLARCGFLCVAHRRIWLRPPRSHEKDGQ